MSGYVELDGRIRFPTGEALRYRPCPGVSAHEDFSALNHMMPFGKLQLLRLVVQNWVFYFPKAVHGSATEVELTGS